MKFDSFLTSPRWEILQILAKKPSSPIELAKELNTTVAYMSQQLKLLDAASLVIKTKTGASQKGKPRSLFRLSEEKLYLVSLTKGFAEKKLVTATSHHKIIFKIWVSVDSSLHYSFEKLYWKLEEEKGDVEGIFIEISSSYPKMLVISESKKLKTKIDNFLGKFERKIDCSFITKTQLKKFDVHSLISLYDPSNLRGEVKGGKE